MEELLKSLYIKLDSTAQSLTKDAIGQLLIKIIYSINEGCATKHEILQQYDNIVKTMRHEIWWIVSCLNWLRIVRLSVIKANIIYHRQKKIKLQKHYRNPKKE